MCARVAVQGADEHQVAVCDNGAAPPVHRTLWRDIPIQLSTIEWGPCVASAAVSVGIRVRNAGGRASEGCVDAAPTNLLTDGKRAWWAQEKRKQRPSKTPANAVSPALTHLSCAANVRCGGVAVRCVRRRVAGVVKWWLSCCCENARWSGGANAAPERVAAVRQSDGASLHSSDPQARYEDEDLAQVLDLPPVSIK